MSNSCPGGQYANGAVRVLVEPIQPLPVNNGVGDQNRLPEITTMVQGAGCAQGVRKRAPEDSGIPRAVDPTAPLI